MFPKLGFLVRKQTIWQLCAQHIRLFSVPEGVCMYAMPLRHAALSPVQWQLIDVNFYLAPTGLNPNWFLKLAPGQHDRSAVVRHLHRRQDEHRARRVHQPGAHRPSSHSHYSLHTVTCFWGRFLSRFQVDNFGGSCELDFFSFKTGS
jgi:hypothetical protein